MAQSSPPSSLPSTLASTRDALHRLAEHVISPARHAVTGRIGLRPSPGGFRTPPFGDDGRVVRVEGTDLVVTASDAPERRAPITTLRAAGAFVGIEPGAPEQVYKPSTPLTLDAPLDVDAAAVRVIADWYALGAEGLARLAEEHPEDDPSEAQLWPEHFDLGITAGAVNFGVSPGDEHIEVPYLYVGPHEPPPPDDFFTMPFGAVRTVHDIASADEALAFFREGRARAHQIPSQRSSDDPRSST